MKKVLFILTAILVSMTLMACSENKVIEVSLQDLVIESVDSLTLVDETSTDLELLNSFEYQGYTINITWMSNRTSLINTFGQVTRPAHGLGNQIAVLTAIVSLDGYTYSKDFSVTVLELEDAVYYPVVFDSLGGTSINTQLIEENGYAILPTAPTKTGYTFVGWTVLDGTTFSFNTKITAEITLYAKWEQVVSVLDHLDILYLNDLHGTIEKSSTELGLAYIANYVNSYRSSNPDGVILLGGGDMFQGSALSNYYQGLSTLEIMNLMGFDAMTLGNHEFDWGIETITRYFDGNTANGEANFPLLGANVFYSGTENIIDHVEPYTIIERGNYKIGVIGTMGYGLESSIAQSRINGYVFASPTSYIEYYANYLRTTEQVDLVFAVAHDSGDINYNVSNFTGNSRVDLIFNAHSHQEYANNYYGVPTIQSSSNGKYVGTIRIELDDLSVTYYQNVKSSTPLNTADPAVQTLINTYKAETDSLFNDEIIQSARYLSIAALSNWLAELMRIKTGADIAFHNYGGTRASIAQGESITLGKLYQVFPFDNVIKTVYLDGSQINYFMNQGNAYSSSVSEFQSGVLYKVATNDYLFDKTDNPFINGTNIAFDGTLLRDLVQQELELQALIYNFFDTTNTIQTSYQQPLPRIHIRFNF